MDQLRDTVWDHLFRSGPQTVEQIAGSLLVDASIVIAVTEHEWFEVLDSKVQIAMGKPPKLVG